jgi:4-alpha-glucanotransferase
VSEWTQTIREALRLLGVDRLALSIHDASFPSDNSEETGRGTPYGTGAWRLLEGIAELGFDTVQLGPQGLTHPDNPSPYDGTIFARSLSSVALAPLRDTGWIGEEDYASLIGELPADRGRADHRRNRVIIDRALELAAAAAATDLDGEVAEFRATHADWLERDALYEVLAAEHRTGEVRQWPVLDRTLWADDTPERVRRRRELLAGAAPAIDAYAFRQLVAHRQHAALRRRCRERGLALAGDLQIGMAPRDVWSYQALIWPAYKMGAPPSRTNPEGQPWGYPILDPKCCEAGGPGLAFVRDRLGKLFREYDAVRIDHPHGWVCPWVYRADDPDPAIAVRGGARLWSSPDLEDHPALATLALVRRDQLDTARPRYDDNWVRSLEDEQVAAYACLFDQLVSCAGRPDLLICEVLSTQPRPLAEVLTRHQLGRFRVTQKADLENPEDVYRGENARPEDWIMVGTHDTASIWELVHAWERSGELADQARYLARRLAPTAGGGAELSEWLAGDPDRVAVAKLAELFASDARHVMIFFADLFGIAERYNAPGTIGDHNWTLRLPPDWTERYREAAATGAALPLPRALAMALRARGGAEAEALAARLESLSATP